MNSESYYTNIVQTYLSSLFQIDQKSPEKCIIAVEVFVHLNGTRHLRIIALINRCSSYAVVFFRRTKSINHNNDDIYVIDVLPLNVEFKLDSDQTRSPADDLHPAVITAEDFTLLDFDPLSSTLDSCSIDRKDFCRKIYQLDFTKENFLNFSNQLLSASKFITKGELFSSFDWLKKLKDEANFVTKTCDQTGITESDSGLPMPQFDSNNLLVSADSFLNTMTTSDIFPASNGISASLMSSESSIKAKIIAQNEPDKYKRNIHNPSNRSIVKKKTSDHYQSSPDLMNGSMEINPRYPSTKFYSPKESDHTAYIGSKMREEEKAYCSWENHTLFVGTWNVNGRVDDSLNLNDWLTPPKGAKYPNFYVIGFQELDLSIGSVALNRGNISNLEERWLKLIEMSEPFIRHSYKRLYRSRLSGILMVVYIEKRLEKCVPHDKVLSNKVPTGVFNVMGNKGAVGIRFSIFNSNICFINCHLAAGETNRLRRDQDFREIEKNLIFYDESGNGVSIYDHDLIFLLGDLNYRILNIDAGIVKRLASVNNIEKLLDNDELINESHLVFKRFKEPKITFPPTYKFDPCTNDYDTSEKNRVPSFCDRIMSIGEHCTALTYSSHMSLKSSDHKPVSATFAIGLKRIDRAKRSKVYESIIRSVDLKYNLSLPQAKLDRQEIYFEKVHFYEHRQASISVTNTGQFEFMFHFKDIPGLPRFPDWLTVQQSEGAVKPGETFDLVFEIFINANNVAELNTKSDVQRILILTLFGGKDYFLTIVADLVPTCFGLPLELLISLKSPISTLSRTELYEKCKPYTEQKTIATQETDVFKIPKEMFVMVDYLVNNITEEELFARPGIHSEIQIIREQLDTNGISADFSSVCVHSVAEAMLMFLIALYFPIIPPELMKECMKAHNNLTESIKVISKLPLDNRNLFHYLTSFLKKILEKRSQNGTDIASFGILFVDLFFRPKNLDSSERDICSKFIKMFIEHDSAKYVNFNPSYF